MPFPFSSVISNQRSKQENINGFAIGDANTKIVP